MDYRLELKEYFKLRYRGQYYVAMKTCAIRSLRDEGMNVEDIAEVVFGDSKKSCDVDYHLHHIKPFSDFELVEENWKQWIALKEYPISKENTDYYKDGYVRGYKLEKREI